ncbi:MAG: hypothetical protein CMI53_00675 [Parcubacteria group bacterium]|nr:hypothetical protein [Parcubacteria group bacterium]|tara:strand:- start:2246 stop:2662 length:417 start_codon:yes stop_codon:yes gene_type:complete
MSQRVFVVLIVLGTVIASLSWAMIIFYLDPEYTNFFGFSLFYLSFFLTLSGIIFIISDTIKARLFRRQLVYSRLKTSIRQAILFSTLIIGWLFLRSQGLLRWWNILLLILILTALEFFFISSQKKVYERQNPTIKGTV